MAYDIPVTRRVSRLRGNQRAPHAVHPRPSLFPDQPPSMRAELEERLARELSALDEHPKSDNTQETTA